MQGGRRAARTGKKVEVTSARGESRDVFATPEGHLAAREYLRPVRTRSDGEWVAIDTRLAATGDGSVEPKATSAGSAFSGGGDGPLVRLERAGRSLKFTWPGDVPKPTLEGATATYADILPDKGELDDDGCHAPRGNQAENKEFNDALKKIESELGRKITPAERQTLHHRVSKQGYGYHRIVEEGRGLFGGC
ncbi:hypothetical protein [Streptomyces sp. NPDC018972]|uniref:hypothetical protein n=1 Tax=Streptomyces sp. NPDC018972 TaxID=3365060 RepID=UPI0037A76932